MTESRAKLVKIEVQVQIMNALELQEAGFRAFRGFPMSSKLPESIQEDIGLAIATLMQPQVQGMHLPGAIITGVGFSVESDTTVEQLGWSPPPPDAGLPSA